MTERPFVRVARIEEQHSVGNQYRHASEAGIRKGFDVYRSAQEDGSIVYEAGPEARATVKQIAPDTVEFSFSDHEQIEPKMATALALVAFAEIATDKKSTIKKVVSLVPRNLENPEFDNGSSDPLFVGVLGMEGKGLTPEGELQYKGEPREMLWVATEALKNQVKPLIYSKVTNTAA